MLTVAQFTFGLQRAGQERVVVDLARAFHNGGIRSLVCTTLFEGELADELRQSQIPVHCLHLKKSYDPRALGPVIRYLKNNRVDAVVTHGSSGCLIPRLAALFSRLPAVIHVEHNISDHKRPYQIVVGRLLSNFTDKIVCISECARTSLLKIEKTETGKSVVILNGLNEERMHSAMNNGAARDSAGRIRVAIVARFSEQKGHIYFVEAIRRIVERFTDIEFIFVGGGELRSHIERLVKEYGLEKFCHFLGVRSDVGTLLPTFDVFVLSSLWEGLPISLLEAQCFGIPSVATKVGGIPEVIKDGYNGLIVPPADSEALAAAILRVARDRGLRSNLSLHARETFHGRFTVRNMATKYMNLISDILKQKGFLDPTDEIFAPRAESEWEKSSI